DQAHCRNLSGAREAKRPEMSFWFSDRTFTAKCVAAAKTSQECADLARQTSRSGGSSETEVKLLAVKPRGVPSSWRVVMTVTPVAKAQKAVRRARGSIAGGGTSASAWSAPSRGGVRG